MKNRPRTSETENEQMRNDDALEKNESAHHLVTIIIGIVRISGPLLSAGNLRIFGDSRPTARDRKMGEDLKYNLEFRMHKETQRKKIVMRAEKQKLRDVCLLSLANAGPFLI